MRTTPPFRADHVGSLLRPPELLAARADFAAGTIGAEHLRAVEDAAIAQAVTMQADAGLRSATDGEFRRASWHMDFIYQLGGIEKAPGNLAVKFRNSAGSLEFTPAALHVGSRIRLDQTIFADHFRYLQSAVGAATPKLTIPSPNMVHYRGGPASIDHDVYPDMEEFWSDLSAAYADEVQRLAAAGCTYLQLDDTSLAYLNDPAQRAEIAERGEDAEHLHLRYIQQVNDAIGARPDTMAVTTHMCRGNFRSSWAAEGGYDFVAEALFSELARRRVLPGVRRRALRRLRAAAIRAEGQDGRARPGHDQARRTREPGRTQAPYRRGRQVRPARPALPVAAVRLLLHRRGQRAEPARAGSQAPPHRGKSRATSGVKAK